MLPLSLDVSCCSPELGSAKCQEKKDNKKFISEQNKLRMIKMLMANANANFHGDFKQAAPPRIPPPSGCPLLPAACRTAGNAVP